MKDCGGIHYNQQETPTRKTPQRPTRLLIQLRRKEQHDPEIMAEADRCDWRVTLKPFNISTDGLLNEPKKRSNPARERLHPARGSGGLPAEHDLQPPPCPAQDGHPRIPADRKGPGIPHANKPAGITGGTPSHTTAGAPPVRYFRPSPQRTQPPPGQEEEGRIELPTTAFSKYRSRRVQGTIAPPPVLPPA